MWYQLQMLYSMEEEDYRYCELLIWTKVNTWGRRLCEVQLSICLEGLKKNTKIFNQDILLQRRKRTLALRKCCKNDGRDK
jgi:hypothetical protein